MLGRSKTTGTVGDWKPTRGAPARFHMWAEDGRILIRVTRPDDDVIAISCDMGVKESKRLALAVLKHLNVPPPDPSMDKMVNVALMGLFLLAAAIYMIGVLCGRASVGL